MALIPIIVSQYRFPTNFKLSKWEPMKFLAGSLHNFFLYLTKKMLAMILMLQLIASHYTVQCTTNDSLLPLIMQLKYSINYNYRHNISLIEQVMRCC